VEGVGDVAGAPPLWALLSVYFFLMSPIVNTYERVNEAEADLYGLQAAREPEVVSRVLWKSGNGVSSRRATPWRSASTRTREAYAVSKPISKQSEAHEVWEDPLVAEIRPVVREAIEEALNEELAQALGADRYARVNGRSGYRNGSLPRQLGTALGRLEVAVPRGRLAGPDGQEAEWRSEKLPRYARRMRGIDRAVLNVYLSGTNQRRIQGALRPLLKGLPLSRSTVSRLAGRLEEEREAWMSRNLGAENVAIVYLDGFGVAVRRDGRVVRNPVLVAVGVKPTGEKVLLSLRMAGGESTAAWRATVEDLARRGVASPVLCVTDGSAGLRAAIGAVWPQASVQRCAVHKLRNLLAHAPKHAHDLVREDFHRIVYAETASAAETAYEKFLSRWSKRCPAVAHSLEEAGSELLTFTSFPPAMWKSLRTTNIIERLNEEFRRRVKTQAAHSSEEAVLNVLFGLFVSGMVRMRKIEGFQTLEAVVKQRGREAA
jgi:transposase-like protein